MVGCVSGSMGRSGEITNNLINLDIIEDLSFVETPPPMGGCMGC